ncbi:polysaccharide lyase family 8 super-sandwich domain-containing protein [Longitalea luteola]|uniref:polysaccharide lyase family 8 super-sandwich domain-containing protein n=1 Tax=Longitalea luteola TaxID=2812563 RepID=UPI001A95CA02|nr:polysaccharide lyase family 8 super-sandwich domain-containing protein [Longitalea luteola]
MKFKITFLLSFKLFLLLSTQAQSDTILDRYKAYLFRTSALQMTSGGSWSAPLNAHGQWADINYEDREPAGWKVSRHLQRIKEMAQVWVTPMTVQYHDKQLWEKINVALDHWLLKRYKSDNWWHNEIGVPRYMRDILVLLRNDLSALRLKQSLEILAQHKVHDDFVAGNLIWCADLGLHYGALTKDTVLMDRCRKLLMREIQITRGEGVQPDHSFHQHGNRLQMYQYGKAYLWEGLRLAWQLRETSLAFPEEKVNILTNAVLNGWQWMARGIHTVPGTMDRSSSRKGELQAADLRPLIPFIRELDPAKANAFNTMEAIQNGKGSMKGYRYYPYSDFAAYHRPGFSFFLKTISTRTLATESINRENLKGKLLNSGDAYLVKNGREYFDLMPVWDYTLLPGVTTFANAHQIDRQAFVGGVASETEGLFAMDYVLKDKSGTQTLTARKCWAAYQDVVICLLSGMKGTNVSGNIFTALDQCRWQSDITVNKPGNVIKEGIHTVKDVHWIHHAGFAYMPLSPATIDLHAKEVTGTWTSINASETTEKVTEKMFMPVLVHDTSRATGYALALCTTPGEARKLFNRPNWNVLRNDDQCQAIRFNDGTKMAAFYAPGKLDEIQTDKPCLVLIKNGVLYASDPSHTGISVRFTFSGKSFELSLPPGGITVCKKLHR